ncbi:N-6 DNA methylase [Oxalobacteraceae bacterium A2-2]
MASIDTPAARAFWQLADLTRLDGVYDSQLFALAWLAAGRMVTLRQAGDISSIEELVDSAVWLKLLEAGFPTEAHQLVEVNRKSALNHDIDRQAVAVVSALDRELGEQCWDVLSCLSVSSGRRGEAEGTLIPELSSLLLDLVGAPPDSEVWIPFDVKGQLTIEALRRGWRVLATSPMAFNPLFQQLLLTIETGDPQPRTVRMEFGGGEADSPALVADYGLIVPPFGVLVNDDRMWGWDIRGTRPYQQFTRSESWALVEFVNRIKQRAVFVAPQGVLFATGQEQRLRDYLLNRRRPSSTLNTVIALPPGTFGATTIPGAILTFSADGPTDAVFMADLVSGRRLLQEAGDILSGAHEMILEQRTTDKARQVSRDEIGANELSLAPSRYLRKVVDLGDEVVKLGDLFEAVRPLATSRDISPFEVVEVGLPDMNKWQPISHAIAKTTYLKSAPKDSALVRPGDVVIAIKGSVGRVALMGSSAQHRPTVVSQSCLALRRNPNQGDKHLSPEMLVMYLKSPHGQSQLAGLQVGAGVPHISPNTLQSAVSIPVPSVEQCRQIQHDYERLCELEQQIADLEEEITDIARRRWPGDAG